MEKFIVSQTTQPIAAGLNVARDRQLNADWPALIISVFTENVLACGSPALPIVDPAQPQIEPHVCKLVRPLLPNRRPTNVLST